jgi:hypothetical protein
MKYWVPQMAVSLPVQWLSASHKGLLFRGVNEWWKQHYMFQTCKYVIQFSRLKAPLWIGNNVAYEVEGSSEYLSVCIFHALSKVSLPRGIGESCYLEEEAFCVAHDASEKRALFKKLPLGLLAVVTQVQLSRTDWKTCQTSWKNIFLTNIGHLSGGCHLSRCIQIP